MAEELRNRVDETAVKCIGQELKQVLPHIEVQDFVQSTMKSWPDLGLNQRVSALRTSLEHFLPKDYSEARVYLITLAPKVQSGYEAIFIPEYIAHNGLSHFKLALGDLAFATSFSTSEFAIRAFIEKDSPRTMKQMLVWASSENEHVRRLASEGCRPRLPWGRSLKAFIQDPWPIIPILEKLKADSSLYVRKSVANNLNDISKDHPELVLQLAKKWLGHSKQTDWILKRALRSLLKQGRPEALELFGFRNGNDFHLEQSSFSSKSIDWEGKLDWKFQVKNPTNSAQKLRLEYKLHFKRTKGSNAKVFQIGEYDMMPNEVLSLSRKHSFRELSTRKHRSGEHKIEIVLNGISRLQHKFELAPKK